MLISPSVCPPVIDENIDDDDDIDLCSRTWCRLLRNCSGAERMDDAVFDVTTGNCLYIAFLALSLNTVGVELF